MATVPTWEAGALVQPQQVVAPRAPNGFVFKATQAASGRTGTAEPNWPLVAGNTVVDNEVTWEAVTATSITWEAVPIYKSGATEPAWPTTIGATVVDGSITWRTRAPNVSDSKCPNTKQVIIAASKVFAAYNDVVRYSATNNPEDWSTAEDAGFLPTGLQAQVDPIVTALGLYRGNLVAMSAGETQVWQVDPDPSRMVLIDSIPSIGTIYHRAMASVAGDLYFNASLGVRSLSIAGGSTNLQAGDVGTPIDTLVQADATNDPIGLFYPSAGQYWLQLEGYTWVYSQSRLGGIGAWSRYRFLPGEFSDYAQQNGNLYLRIGNTVYKVDETTGQDAGQNVNTGTIQWNWLDLGQPGQEKYLIGADVVGSGSPSISVGYDETNQAAFTAPYAVPADTQPGKVIPLPVAGPSFSLRVTYAGGVTRWELQAASLYLNDMRLSA